jgi:predicted nucleic acid-binding protein
VAVLIDTNIFIEHLHSRLNLLSLQKKKRDQKRYKYSFSTARELLCLDGQARIIPAATRYVGANAAGLKDSTILGYLTKHLRGPRDTRGRPKHGERPRTYARQLERPNPIWLRSFRRELDLLRHFGCLPITSQIRNLAHQLLRNARLSDEFAHDSIIAATALIYRMQLLSADTDFDLWGVPRIPPASLGL